MSWTEPDDAPQAHAIPRRSQAEREDDPLDFHGLRALGIEWSQAASGKEWTDYNLHDPGVTILEQLAFSLTELAYRIDLPVADHLARADGTIDYTGQALFPPQDILPCRPTTAGDYRRLFLDRIPGLLDAHFDHDGEASVDGQDDGKLPGLHRLHVRLADQRATRKAAEIAADAHDCYRANRGFCEDLDADVIVITPRLFNLRLAAEIGGERDPADILAEIYHVCGSAIAGPPPAEGFDALVARGTPLDRIFDGPALLSGQIDGVGLTDVHGHRLVVSDLRPLVLAVDGVTAVTRLELYGDDDVVCRILDWSAGTWAPRLKAPWRDRPAAEVADQSQVRLTRRGAHVPVNPRAVERRYADDLRPATTDRAATRPFTDVLPPPKGRHRPPLPHESVQDMFPSVYGIGPHGAADLSVRGMAHSQQLKAYLALFDHLLANGAGQVEHLRDLFSPDRELERSYWRRVLTDAEVPGIEDLYLKSRDEICESVHASFDEADQRRARVLDYLLALYGESFPQNTSRQFLDHRSSRETAAVLLANKVEYLKQTVILGRDRAAGVDYGLEPWSTPEATTGLHRRICLLVGFSFWHARSLTKAFGADPVGPGKRPKPRSWVMESDEDRTHALSWPPEAHEPSGPPPRRMRSLLRNRRLLGVLLEHGVYRRRYRFQKDAVGSAGRLWLASEPDDAWWSLGRVDDAAAATELADALRRQLIALNDASEGLHIVEHILLRPRTGPVDPDFHGLRATFVLPDWSARTTRPAFRDFVEETVRINCPAHVLPSVIWLDFEAMAEFEKLYRGWASRLAASPGAPRRADAAAADLCRFLARHTPEAGRG